jgi:type III restriction enzyme
MRYTLKDYQVDAVAELLSNLADARDFYHRRGRESSFALTATTGAGKTVMAAAAIEALFYGDDSFGFEPDPSAVVLWFSDDPSLNEQTRFRLLAASDKVVHSDLVVIEYPFSVQKLSPRKVYFLNTGKLTKSSLLTRGHDSGDDVPEFEQLNAALAPDDQAFTVWQTIANTIEDQELTLYLILDEAHRGMGARQSADKPTIVKRLINGHAGIPPMPVVWGVSATVQRFDDAMAAAEVSSRRTSLPKVVVDPIRVQESGLLKDDIVLDIPAEAGRFDTVLLTRATRKIVESTQAWSNYAAEQNGAEPVIPLMVVQSPNTPDPALLARALDTIYREWPDLRDDQIAHVLGEHTTQQWGQHQVPYISPERVQDARHVRVLIAKDAISTGWDCPRAEVLISFRPARDATHITQLLGRMVRTPLARRIPGNETLNSVSCILPFFDRRTATNVVRVLGGTLEGLPDQPGRRVLIDPQSMFANEAVPAAVWESLESMPSESLPRRGAKPVKRLMALAYALAADGIRPDAGKQARDELHSVLDGCSARHKDAIAKAVAEVWTVRGESVTGHFGNDVPTYGTFAETADDRSIQDVFREAGRALTADLAGSYANHLAGPDDQAAADDGLRDAYVQVAALAMVPAVREELDQEADKLAAKWLDEYRVAIKGQLDERQAIYNDIRSMSTEPQRLTITRPNNAIVETKTLDAEGNQVAIHVRSGHLLSSATGAYPVGNLNDWEIEVLDKEIGRPGAVAWYRNPARSSQDSIGVAYKDGEGTWRSMRPDFVFFAEGSEGIEISIVDPHSHHLSDAIPKLRGLARYAERYNGEVHRIEAVTKIGETLRVLDMTNATVRLAVGQAEDAKALYLSHGANYY